MDVNGMRRDGGGDAADEWPADVAFRRRPLPPPRRTTGRERRWLDSRRGLIKRSERFVDRVVARYVYPHLFGLWHPYCWQLRRRFTVATATVKPARWPCDVPDLRVLLLSDIHTGAFLRPVVLESIFAQLMRFRPDLVAIAGDIVEGRLEDLDGFLPALGTLAAAPLGAWYCLGNHDYFTEAPDRIREQLASVGIATLRNATRTLGHAGGAFVLGGVDDRTLGTPDWDALVASGPPHLLLAHHPDDFYEAERRGVALVLSGHTHGGQIRLPGGPPIVRQSRFRLDEGLYVHGDAMLAVSRGLGAVGLPWRVGADPEAVVLQIRSTRA
jgi:predicted MPP superfamily phosphohydrolase